MKIKELDISLTRGQADFLQSECKYPAFCAGYGAGKSHTMGLCGSLDMQHSSSCIVGFYEPYYDLIRTVAVPNVQKWLTEFGISYTLNKQDGAIYTSNSGVGDAYFRSMDNVEALVGYETYRSHIDELDTMPLDNAEKAFFKIMGRNRQAPLDVPVEHRKWVEKTQQYECINKISVYTTPEGFKFCYKMWHPTSDNAIKNKEFRLYKGRTQDNPTLTEDYIQSLKDTYPALLLKAYMEGEFVNMESGAVYYNFNREIHNTQRTIQKDDVLHIGIDFNVQHTCGIVFIDEDNKTKAVAEVVEQLDTPALIRTIKNLWPQHVIHVYPDNSGVQRTSTNANTNNIALLKQAGFRVHTRTKNPKVENRIASVIKLLEDGRFLVNTRECPTLTKCLEQQAYDDKGNPDKSTGLDHPLDGMGYKIEYTHSIRKSFFSIPITFMNKE